MTWFHQRRPADGGLISRPMRIWDEDAGCLVPSAPLPKVSVARLFPDAPVPHIPGVISFDTRPIFRMIKQISDRMAKAAANPAVKAAVRQAADRRHIQGIADRELHEARMWLDLHVEGVYAALGLERPV